LRGFKLNITLSIDFDYMALRFYNTLSKTEEDFKPIQDRQVLYYTCGPTVHDYAHIGNFRTFVVQDVLKRWLEYRGYSVKHVMNITDVDEKTIERATRKNIPLSNLTSTFEKAFFEDLDCLNIKRANHYPRVTDNIDEIARLIKDLHKKGHALIDEEGSYYYDVNSFKGYGKLSGIIPRRRIRALMPREDYKTPKNFLLWKACNKSGCRVCWNTVLGRGMPGWHIECAALAKRYLGRKIDIHSGGIDLIFPHHENEIAEVEGYSGEQFSRFWVHVDHLIVFGKKMSKSLGNFFTIRQVIRRGFDPFALRLLYLKTHYRSPLNFDFEALQMAQDELKSIQNTYKKIEAISDFGRNDFRNQVNTFEIEFSSHMDDDLQTNKAWKAFFELIKDVNHAVKGGKVSKRGTQRIRKTFEWVNRALGVLEECKSTQ
jgi:cysteinyl-tRNA synthetase